MKKNLFFENARLLNEKLNIIPLMYGSLGLEYLTGENLDSDDIDILIPEGYLTGKWNSFKKLLTAEGFTLADEREHSFLKDGISYSYASLEELEDFAGIDPSGIDKLTVENSEFLLLNLNQYLCVYQASLLDGYRVEVRGKKDNDKILLIKSLLGNI